MFESVFYTVAPMLVLGFVAVPVALVLSVCAGVYKHAEWREYKAALAAEAEVGVEVDAKAEAGAETSAASPEAAEA